MSEMTVGTALREAREAIDAERHEEAMLLARHVLREHPSCVQAYRLLAEAALERGDHKQAEDLFLRALSVDPEDHLSWFGLAMLAEGEERLEEALRYARRAFDLEPYKPGIRELWARLQRRVGVPPEQVQVSRAALARLLARGGLYEQAIQEYRTALEWSPGRVDLLVGLAQALWHHGRRIEAAEVCQQVLEHLPNCLKVHLLLGEIWRRAGRENEAQPFLMRAQELDPLNEVAQELLGERSPLPARDLPLAPLEEEPELLWEPLELEEAPSLEEPAPAAPAAAPPSVEEEVLPEEAEAMAEPPPEAEETVPEWPEALEEKAEVAEAAPPAPEGQVEEMAAEASLTAEVAEEEPSPEVEEPLPIWLEEQPEAAPEEEEFALPPWLQEVMEQEVEEEAPAPEEPAPAPAEAAATGEQVPTTEGVPDWLAELRRRVAAPQEEPQTEGPAEAEAPPATETVAGPGALALEEAPPAEVAPEAVEAVEEGIAPEAPPMDFAARDVAEIAASVEGAPAEVTEAAEAPPPAEGEAAEVAEEAPPVAPEVEEPTQAVEAAAPEEAVAEEAFPAAPTPEEEVAQPPEKAAPVEILAEEVPEEAPPAPAAEETPEEVPEALEATPEAALPPEAQDALARLATRPADHAARLLVARAYAAQGQMAEALTHYQHLVTADEVLSQVVEDLENLAVRAPHLARTYQLLGDALMHQGRLNEALDAYRQALLRLQGDEAAPSSTTPR